MVFIGFVIRTPKTDSFGLTRRKNCFESSVPEDNHTRTPKEPSELDVMCEVRKT